MSKNSDAAIALLEKHFDIAFAAPDGIKKLRELILSLAMQGKLVPQDPNDQPASELLKEIEAEKERLIKEGKIKKSKPLPEIKPDDIPYDLPKSWEWVYLGKLTTFTYGKTPESKNPIYWSQTDGETWAAISDLPLRGYLYSTNKKITQQAVDDVFKSEPLPVGTLLMSFKLSIGKTAISQIPVYHNEAIISFRELIPELKMYLFWILSSISNSGDHKNAIKGNTLNSTSLNNLQIPLPPLAEQRRIVAKIDELMARCDELERLRGDRDRKQITVHTAALNRLLIAKEQSNFNIAWQFITQHFGELYSVKENVTELRKAILQLAVMGKLVPQDFSDQPASELLKEIEAEKERLIKEEKIRQSKPLPEIEPDEVPYDLPKGWQWARLGNVSLSSDSGWSPQCLSEPRSGQEWGVLKVSAVSWGEFKPEENKALPQGIEPKPECEVRSGDFLMSRANTDELVARSVVVKVSPSHLMMSDKIVRFNLSQKNNKNFINYTNLSQFSRDYYARNASGTSSSMKNISREVMNNLPIPIPPLAEQHRIVDKIDQLMALCDNLEKQFYRANSKQTNLLNAVMTKI